MRYLLGIVIANIVLLLVAYTMTIGHVYSVGSSIDFAGFGAAGGFWTMAAATLAGFCFFTVITDPPLLVLARLLTDNRHLQHALADVAFVLALAGICFVPLAAFLLPPMVIAATLTVVATGAFVGGWCRELIMNRNAVTILGSEAFA